MGVVLGNEVCMVNVICFLMCYGNLGILEDGYGINFLFFVIFVMDIYVDDFCIIFVFKINFVDFIYNEKILRLIIQMYKVIIIIQFKLEVNIINCCLEFGMGGCKLFEKIDFEWGVFVYEGKEYLLCDINFFMVDFVDFYCLIDEEQELIEKIYYLFMNSEKFKKYMCCFFIYGGMYLVCNFNLFYYVFVFFNEDGSFKYVNICGKEYWGKNLLDKID